MNRDVQQRDCQGGSQEIMPFCFLQVTDFKFLPILFFYLHNSNHCTGFQAKSLEYFLLTEKWIPLLNLRTGSFDLAV